jgi:tetratricopeptide (TPR) repeat protein
MMILGVRHAWNVFQGEAPFGDWFERFLTPQYRSAFAAIEGCAPYAVFSAAEVPAHLRTPDWKRLVAAVDGYRDADLIAQTALLRLLGTLSLYEDVSALGARVRDDGSDGRSQASCQHALIVERVRFLLHESDMVRGDVLRFLDIAMRAPDGSAVRIEAAIFFLSRALEKGLSRADIATGDLLAREALASLKAKALPQDHARWTSKYWRCISYDPFLRGDTEESRAQLAAAETAARDCLRLTKKGSPNFGAEDLYGVLTVKVLTEMKLGNTAGCLDALTELVEMDPWGSWQRTELGRLRMSQGDIEGAIKDLQTAVTLGPPRRADSCALLSECYRRLGRGAQARRWDANGRRLRAAERFSVVKGPDTAAPAPRAAGSVEVERRAASHAHLRPFLALEPASDAPALLNGIIPTWRQLDENRASPWYERSLPAAFRKELQWVPGLEAHAVSSVENLPRSLRSPAWTRLLDWKSRYGALELPQQIAVLKLLGMLGFYEDNASLLELGRAPSRSRPLSERESELTYLRANNRVLLDEPGMKGDYSEMFDAAQRCAPGTEIQLLCAIKTMTLYAEHGNEHRNLFAAEVIARETLEGLRSRTTEAMFFAATSRYWRTASYFPFLRKDYAEVDRRLDRAEEAIRKAVSLGTPIERDYARDVLYALLATRVTTDVRVGRPQRALPRLKEMIEQDPRGAWQRLWSGNANLEMGELDVARENFLMAIHLAPPGLHKACDGLARTLRLMGKTAEAEKWARRGILTSSRAFPAQDGARGGRTV